MRIKLWQAVFHCFEKLNIQTGKTMQMVRIIVTETTAVFLKAPSELNFL